MTKERNAPDFQVFKVAYELGLWLEHRDTYVGLSDEQQAEALHLAARCVLYGKNLELPPWRLERFREWAHNLPEPQPPQGAT